MRVGSHDTMSYLKPQWWARPFFWMAQCQSKNYLAQYFCGAQMFDLRVAFDKNGKPFFAHGLASYKSENVYEVLSTLNSLSNPDDKIIIRIMNERNKNWDRFVGFCKFCDAEYTNIQFCGFRNKKYDVQYMIPWNLRGTDEFRVGDRGLDDSDIDFVDKYASWNHDHCTEKHDHCNGNVLDDLFPRIYARRFNQKWRSHYKDYPGILLQDFIGIY